MTDSRPTHQAKELIKTFRKGKCTAACLHHLASLFVEIDANPRPQRHKRGHFLQRPDIQLKIGAMLQSFGAQAQHAATQKRLALIGTSASEMNALIQKFPDTLKPNQVLFWEGQS